MSFDLKNDMNVDFKSNQKETKTLIENLKDDIIKSYEDMINQRAKTYNIRTSYVKMLKKVTSSTSYVSYIHLIIDFEAMGRSYGNSDINFGLRSWNQKSHFLRL